MTDTSRCDTLSAEYFKAQLPECDDMERGILYVSVGFGTAIHLCACGCGGEVVTPLKECGWVLSEGPTLTPSIGNQHWPCRSHYFVKGGKIEWCQG